MYLHAKDAVCKQEAGAMYKLTAAFEMLSPGTTSIFYIIIQRLLSNIIKI